MVCLRVVGARFIVQYLHDTLDTFTSCGSSSVLVLREAV